MKHYLIYYSGKSTGHTYISDKIYCYNEFIEVLHQILKINVFKVDKILELEEKDITNKILENLVFK